MDVDVELELEFDWTAAVVAVWTELEAVAGCEVVGAVVLDEEDGGGGGCKVGFVVVVDLDRGGRCGDCLEDIDEEDFEEEEEETEEEKEVIDLCWLGWVVFEKGAVGGGFETDVDFKVCFFSFEAER